MYSYAKGDGEESAHQEWLCYQVKCERWSESEEEEVGRILIVGTHPLQKQRRKGWGTLKFWREVALGEKSTQPVKLDARGEEGIAWAWAGWENKRNQMSTDHVPKSEAMATTVLAPALTPAADAQRRDDDRELVRLAKADDHEAFELLIKRHQSRVFAVASGILRNKEDVEDIAQQVFVKAYFSLKKFDQRAAFSTWLYKITVNECWDVLRKKKSRPLYFEAELSEEQARQYKASEDVESPGVDVSDRLASRQRVEHLLGFLDERDRAMLVLKEVQGFSVEEIAEMLEINGNTVKVRLFRARRRIVERMKRRETEK